ncbi:MAG TPA: galactonate dehydratase [Chloroflexota bacterium]|nr:galactonate dehydratase [Chloroflexota bacterium]
MKITKLELLPVKPRWVFLKMHTDEGIVGYGEPVLEGRARTTMTAVRELESYLIGQDPRRIEHHWQAMYRGTFYRGGPILVSAISGIEQAMWDIKGKALGLPVYALLGGPARDRIRMYAHCRGETPEKSAEAASAVVAKGFTALKTSFPMSKRIIETPGYIERCVRQLGAMREAVGPEVDIAIDFFHGGYPPAMAIRLAKELEPFRPLFIEEPCLPENIDAMVNIARATSIPVATGERLFTRWGFRELIEKQAAAILQPDLCHAGGIFEVRKIAAMAETYYLNLAPHCPLGPIALAACLQLDASIPNFLLQEHVTLGEGYLKQPFVVKDGYVDLPTAPGLGIELDDEAVAAGAMEPNWDSPRNWFEDGAVADW